MTRHLPAALGAVLTLAALAACTAGEGPGAGPSEQPDSVLPLAGVYEVVYSDPVVVESSGFLSTTTFIASDDGNLMLTIEFEEPDTDGSRGTGSGIGISERLEITCLNATECWSLGGAGRLVMSGDEARWKPTVASYSDDFFDGCAPGVVPDETVPLRSVETGADGRVTAFTVDVAYVANQSHMSEDPDATAGGPCSFAVLVALELTATRTD